PGPISTTIDLGRTALYLQDAMAGFSFVPGNIAFQTRPLVIVETVNVPDAEEFTKSIVKLNEGLKFSLTQTTPLLYLGCWIKSRRMRYDLAGNDQIVSEDISLDVSRIIQPLSLIPIVGESLQKTLAENVPLVGAVSSVVKKINVSNKFTLKK